VPQLALFYSKAVMLFSHECANKKLTHLIFFYLSQAIFSPASFLLWCSSSEPGYLQPQMATNTMKPPVHIMAFMFPVVNHMITKLDIIVNTIAYLNLVGILFFLPSSLGTVQTTYGSLSNYAYAHCFSQNRKPHPLPELTKEVLEDTRL